MLLRNASGCRYTNEDAVKQALGDGYLDVNAAGKELTKEELAKKGLSF